MNNINKWIKAENKYKTYTPNSSSDDMSNSSDSSGYNSEDEYYNDEYFENLQIQIDDTTMMEKYDTCSSDSENSEDIDTYSCIHYKNHCKLKTLCCDDIVFCKLCHDSKEDHVLTNNNISKLICKNCDLAQDVSNKCERCDIIFGKYNCEKCIVYDNTESVYHCSECEICLSDSILSFKHCNKCKCCSISETIDHICIRDVLYENCPICMDNFINSKSGIYILECKHVMHIQCYSELVKTFSKCPVCLKALK